MDNISKELRVETLKLANKCQDGNLQSAFSCIDIIWVLYDKIMNWSRDSALDDNRDFFIISKGQATLALHAILKKKNFFEEKDIEGIGKFNSKFSIQADSTKFDGGIENNAGSLGHGLPFAAGIAMANKIKESPSKVFVLVGDGEFNEGTMWEACIFAAGKKLDNLCVIIDDNHSVGAMIDMIDMQDKLESFGFCVYKVDGHNLRDLETVLKRESVDGKPIAIIADTIRGYGSSTMMSHDIWFHKAPNIEELQLLSEEVKDFEKNNFKTYCRYD